MLMVAKFCKIPNFIAVMHELGSLRSWARRALITALAPKNLIFAGVSNAVRNDMRQDLWWLPPGRIITLYNMIDFELTEPRLYSRAEARERLGLAPEAFVFGNIGRLAINKDQKTLIEAFARLPHCEEHSDTASQGLGSGAQTHLVLIGDGVLENDLKQQVSALDLGAAVHFTGFLPEGFRYMKAFDV
jgi:glycosyltransferase involved in cell wall biosynthesis